MKEKLVKVTDTAKTIWTKRSKGQKLLLIVSLIALVCIIAAVSWFTSKTEYVPLYNNLSIQETSQIKTELETRKIPYKLENGGTTITVPKESADDLLVDLAGLGIPDSGSIDYSFFSENSSWGITDNEFDMMKLDATQTELSNLIKSIDGIDDAKVMINMPKDQMFVSEKPEEASASIVINTKPGYQFKGNQIESLYHLVSKAVPNLPEDKIVITNQYFEYFDKETDTKNGNIKDYNYQQTVKSDIERDIQRRLQQMVGAMVGQEKAIVSVTADIDFTSENRVEELVEPVDLENMEGLPVSIESVHETYSGKPTEGGVAGTGDEDVPGYQATETDENGDYKLVKETINNEFNRIRKEIVESPYKIRDLGIQVAVDSAVDRKGKDVQLLNQQEQTKVQDGITSILDSMITTSIDKEYGEIDPEEKISIVFQEFSGTNEDVQPKAPIIPMWIYIVGGILLVAIVILVIFLVRNKKKAEVESYEETDEIAFTTEESEVPDIEKVESESTVRKKQLEKMAQDKPEEFTKLLRSWISED